MGVLHSELIQSGDRAELDALVRAETARIKAFFPRPFWLRHVPLWDWKTGIHYCRIDAMDSEPVRIETCPEARYELVTDQPV